MNKRLIDGDKLNTFAEKHLNIEMEKRIKAAIHNGILDAAIPDQGEAARLREALKEWMQNEIDNPPFYGDQHVGMLRGFRKLRDLLDTGALSSHKEDTGMQKVRRLWDLAIAEGKDSEDGYYSSIVASGELSGIKKTLTALGITIPGITDGGDK